MPSRKKKGKSSKSAVSAKAVARAELVAKASYQRKRTITEVIPPDVTRAKANAFLKLISPLTEWAELKADEIQHRRELFRIKREETLTQILRDARERMQEKSESFSRIPSKFFVPFAEKASLEESNDDLMKMWSELLASAASDYDPVHLRIIDILAQIGPAETNYLRVLWKSSRSKRDLHLVVEAPYFFHPNFSEFTLRIVSSGTRAVVRKSSCSL